MHTEHKQLFPQKLLINLLLLLALKSAQKFHFMKILWELNIDYNNVYVI